MKRRGFLKSLAAVSVVVPFAIKEVAEAKELTNVEKAQKIDSDFTSPFLYVQAMEDIKQGQTVRFSTPRKDHVYQVSVYRNSLGLVKACGIACADVKKDQWFFIQTVGHCILPK